MSEQNNYASLDGIIHLSAIEKYWPEIFSSIAKSKIEIGPRLSRSNDSLIEEEFLSITEQKDATSATWFAKLAMSGYAPYRTCSLVKNEAWVTENLENFSEVFIEWFKNLPLEKIFSAEFRLIEHFCDIPPLPQTKASSELKEFVSINCGNEVPYEILDKKSGQFHSVQDRSIFFYDTATVRFPASNRMRVVLFIEGKLNPETLKCLVGDTELN